MLKNGGAAITVPDDRWARCDVKVIGLTANVLARSQAVDAGAYEAIFVRDGYVTDAASCNVFAIFGTTLMTAPCTNYILWGITREVTLELAREDGIDTLEASFRVEQLREADEIFVTGTSSGIVPIVSLDGAMVGNGPGRPGDAAPDGAVRASDRRRERAGPGRLGTLTRCWAAGVGCSGGRRPPNTRDLAPETHGVDMASTETPTIGFIGLGQMGAPMVRNLIKAGYRPVIHNRSRAIVETIAAEGASPAASAREVAERVEILFSCVGFPGRRRAGVPGRGWRRRRRTGRPGLLRPQHRRPGHPSEDRGPARGEGRRLPGRPDQRRHLRRRGRHADDHGRRRRRSTSSGSARCST